MNFKELYDNVAQSINPQQVNKMVSSCSEMAVIETKEGNTYYGASMDARCGLGITAEQAAIANMVTYGEFEIAKIVIVRADGSLVMPGGVSRELMLELSPANSEAEILMDVERQKMVKLGKLLPLWWGESEY